MDKPNVDSTIDALASLVKDGHTPAHDFSLNELEGILAFKLGVDVSVRELVAALGALGVARKGTRLWDRTSFKKAVQTYMKALVPA